MNAIQKLLDINENELKQNTPDHASWHADYSDTSYIYIGNLDLSLEEKDILTIFSQYGNPTHINLVKDKDTGKPRGFCFLKYEDQRSCVLAIDNFNGTLIYERPLKVDHTYFRLAPGQNEDDFRVEYPEVRKPKQIKHKETLLTYEKESDSDRETEAKESNVMKLPPLESVSMSAPKFDDDDFEDPMANMVGSKRSPPEGERHSKKPRQE